MKMKSLMAGMMALIAGLTGCTAQTTGFESLGVEEFEQRISDDEEVVRVDVRTAEEYADGHVADAANIDVLRDDFGSRASASLPKDKTIAVYCRSGKRSKKAAGILVKNGYRVVELDSGYMGWTAAGKPVTKDEVDVFTTAGGTVVRMYCIKHGSVRMNIGGKWIYVDPVTTAAPPATDYSAMPKADVILITHEHHDHLDSVAIRQLTKEGTELVCNPRCHKLLGNVGRQMANGDSLTLGGWRIDAVPAYNRSPEKLKFHPKGRDNGYVVSVDGFRIYIGGDTEDIPEMQDIADIDVAFLPCNLPYTMTPARLADAARMVSPRVLFPYHYGETDIRQAESLLDGSGIDVRIRQYQ